MNLWYVVICNDGCSTVPKTWLSHDLSSVYWPPKKLNVRKAINQRKVPDSTWTCHAVKLQHGPFADETLAKNVEKQVAELSSSDENILNVTPYPIMPPKRLHRPTNVSSSEEDDPNKEKKSKIDLPKPPWNFHGKEDIKNKAKPKIRQDQIYAPNSLRLAWRNLKENNENSSRMVENTVREENLYSKSPVLDAKTNEVIDKKDDNKRARESDGQQSKNEEMKPVHTRDQKRSRQSQKIGNLTEKKEARANIKSHEKEKGMTESQEHKPKGSGTRHVLDEKEIKDSTKFGENKKEMDSNYSVSLHIEKRDNGDKKSRHVDTDLTDSPKKADNKSQKSKNGTENRDHKKKKKKRSKKKEKKKSKKKDKDKKTENDAYERSLHLPRIDSSDSRRRHESRSRRSPHRHESGNRRSIHRSRSLYRRSPSQSKCPAKNTFYQDEIRNGRTSYLSRSGSRSPRQSISRSARTPEPSGYDKSRSPLPLRSVSEHTPDREQNEIRYTPPRDTYESERTHPSEVGNTQTLRQDENETRRTLNKDKSSYSPRRSVADWLFDDRSRLNKISSTSEMPQIPKKSLETKKSGGSEQILNINRQNCTVGCVCYNCDTLALIKDTLVIIHDKLNHSSNMREGDVEERAQSQRPERFEILPAEPLKTVEELTSFETLIKTNHLALEKFKQRINRKGGKDAADTTRKVMPLILTNSLAREYSWKGQKNNREFQKSPIATTIIEEIVNSFPGATETLVAGAISQWLRKTGDRIKNDIRKSQRNE